MLTGTTPLARAGATAMKRVELSRPVRLALEAGVIREQDAVFDYGCGHGHDVEFLRELGHRADGWDPHHRPDADIKRADVVNLGYVLNVVEDPSDRVQALRDAWRLASRALVVAVRTVDEARFVSSAKEHVDGVLTGAETFQRFFRQSEARGYIDCSLEVQSIPLAPGVFVAFKDDAAEQEWLDSRATLRRRVRRLRRITEPRKTLRDEAYEQHREQLRPLEEFIAERGRLPADDEAACTTAVVEVFGSLPRAFQVIRHVADSPWWDAASEDRRNELLVRFALARLRRRPRFSALPESLQRDIKVLFGSYKAACKRADELLFSIGDPSAVKHAASASSIGKRTPEAIYAHVEAIDLLPSELRVFVGAADALIGQVPDATLVKAHLDKPRVSYLVYPDFDTDPHPALAESWVVDFRELDVRPHDYRGRENPPILHRKELFVAPDHPRFATFERLSVQEERHGLLDDAQSIGTRRAWSERLRESGWTLRGHRLVRVPGARVLAPGQ
jgi:DNA phosphorothioation-associated putative methyltransferase